MGGVGGAEEILVPQHAQAIGIEPAVELGYRLARPYWGQGYATEAAAACGTMDSAIWAFR